MSWSLDWFAAELLAKSGAKIRRAGWTDKHVEQRGAVAVLVTDSGEATVKATDFGADDFRARDWTDESFNANPCAATPAFNTTPPVYRQWTDQPLFLPPPAPGFPSPP